MIETPASTPMMFAAIVAGSRSPGPLGKSLPMKDLRETPSRTGNPSPTISSRCARIGEILFERLAEADAGIEHDAVIADAGRRRALERFAEERLELVDDVERGVGFFTVVHDDDGGIVGGDGRRHVRIARKTPYVVDDLGAGGSACSATLAL